MGVREDCRHYVQRSTPGGELLQRCRLGAAEETPFACPDDCLFFEARVLSTAGWAQEGDEAMSEHGLGAGRLAAPAPQRRPVRQVEQEQEERPQAALNRR